MNLSNAGQAPLLTTVKDEGKDINVYIEVKEEKEYNSIKDVTNIEIQTPLGTTVKVGDVMDVEEGKTPDTIERRQGKMYASVSADVTSKDVAAISTAVENKISEQSLPNGVKVEFGGVTEQIDESFTQLGMAMLAAVAIVYFVLVVTFGGALAPLAILFSLPFTIIGSLVALWIAKEPLSVSAMIGALMLIGIVVTNAIVLIDRAIHNEKDGLTTREALLEAGSYSSPTNLNDCPCDYWGPYTVSDGYGRRRWRSHFKRTRCYSNRWTSKFYAADACYCPNCL